VVSFLFLPTLSEGAESEPASPPVGLKFKLNADPRVPPVDEGPPVPRLALDGVFLEAAPNYLPGVKRELKIDTTGLCILREKYLDQDVRLPAVLSLNEYLAHCQQEQLASLWRQKVTTGLGKTPGEKTVRGPGGINLDIPVQIKSKAFQSIFGGSTVGLNVTGDISITGGLRHEKRSEVRTSFAQGSNYNFRMQQTQRFQVTGKVGEKVTVNVDQDSERPFDFENTIRLHYTGGEDEIVQSVEAGNVNLSLPATRFVSFSGKNTGLFGIKSNMVMGNLRLTAIASQEKGESKKLSLTGGASEGTQRIEDYQYRRYTYFFLDEEYRKNYPKYDAQGVPTYNPSLRKTIRRIEVYKSDANYENKEGAVWGWAILGAKLDPTTGKFMEWDPQTQQYKLFEDTTVTNERYRGYFIRMQKDVEYYYQPDLGYIRLENPLSEGEVLAVAYQDTAGNVYGDINFNTTKQSTIVLKLIKARTPTPDFATWNLEWKNVYYLGGRNIDKEGFALKIFFKPPSGPPEETQTTAEGKSLNYVTVFGLDQVNQSGEATPDGVIDFNPSFLNLGRGELIFPALRPFDPRLEPKWYYVQDPEKGLLEKPVLLDSTKFARGIYDTTSAAQSFIARQSRFYIEVKSKNRSATYQLGFNVIENSEVVTLNGRTLNRGQDYVIDYFSGTLTILDEQATAASANVDITYELNQLFQIEKKNLLGVRAEYQLWEDSFIGSTFLYLNERTLDQKVRLGKAPIQNMIWDVNAAFKFRPKVLTDALDRLPIVETEAPSTLSIEGELAQVLPNPNTRNNPKTGDPSGVAYVDDFEGSKKTSPLGVERRGWRPASAPRDPYAPSNISRPLDLSKRGHLLWYNPWEQVAIKEIWPKRDVNPNVPQRQNVLAMVFYPNDAGRNSWGGIQRYLGAGFSDQSDAKFLEVWVSGDTGTLHIDLGQISEDVIPNQKLDSEDRRVRGIRNGNLDPGEDVGLDGMEGPDPPEINHPHQPARVDTVNGVRRGTPYDFWDVNGNGVKEPEEPWSYDDWSYSERSLDYSKVNGTERNENDGARIPDTEDINRNGDVDLRNEYFEYTIHLGKRPPDGGQKSEGGGVVDPATGRVRTGWWLYRIPLDEPSKVVGRPSLSLIEYARIWVDGFERPGYLWIAEVNLVGNDWKELGVALSLADTAAYKAYKDTTVAVTEVNVQDNPDYKSPPGVEGELDRITQTRGNERSLVLRVRKLPAHAKGAAQKSFFQPQNEFIRYHTLKMYVRAIDSTATRQAITDTSSQVEFFFQFGADNRNYYEFRERVYPGNLNSEDRGWDRRNEMIIDLDELAAIKISGADSLEKFVTVGGRRVRKVLRVVGRPSLTNVRVMTAGVINHGPGEFDGQVWMNELRVSNVRKDKGAAMRVRADVTLADVARINAEVNRQNADFHPLNQRFGDGDNRLGGTFNANISLEKLLPRSWGISIPTNLSYSRSEATPKYLPGSDILTKSEAVSPAKLDSIRTLNTQQGFSISFRRTGQSKNFFVKNSLDRLSVSYAQTAASGSNPTMASQRSSSYNSDIAYGLDFTRKVNFRPLGWLGDAPIVKKLSGSRFYLLPTNLDLRLSANRATSNSLSRSGVLTPQHSFTVTRSARLALRPFDPMTLDFNRTHLSDARGLGQSDFARMHFGQNLSVDQSFSAKYNPTLFSWLTNNFSYSAGFKWTNNLQQRSIGTVASTNKNITASLTLDFSRLLRTIYKPQAQGAWKAGAPGRPGGQPRRDRLPPGQEERRAPGEFEEREEQERLPPGRQNIPELPGETQPVPPPPPREPGKATPTDTSKAKAAKEKKPEKPGVSILAIVDQLFSKLQPISIQYSQRNSYSNSGLEGMPTRFGYLMGFTKDPGVATVSTIGTFRSTDNQGQTWSASTSLRVSSNLEVSLRYNYTTQRNASTNINGSITQSRFKLKDSDFPFPEWTVRWSGFENFFVFKRVAQRVSLDHSFAGQKSTTWQDRPNNRTKDDLTTDFKPFVGITVGWKNGMTTTLRYNISQTLSRTTYGGQGSTRTTTRDLNVTTNYSKSSGFKLPLPFLKNKELKNSIDFTATFSMSRNVVERNLATDVSNKAGWVVQQSTERWSLAPRMTYSFNTRVRGGTHFEIGKTKSTYTGTTSIKEFGLDVNIAIRGG